MTVQLTNRYCLNFVDDNDDATNNNKNFTKITSSLSPSGLNTPTSSNPTTPRQSKQNSTKKGQFFDKNQQPGSNQGQHGISPIDFDGTYDRDDDGADTSRISFKSNQNQQNQQNTDAITKQNQQVVYHTQATPCSITLFLQQKPKSTLNSFQQQHNQQNNQQNQQQPTNNIVMNNKMMLTRSNSLVGSSSMLGSSMVDFNTQTPTKTSKLGQNQQNAQNLLHQSSYATNNIYSSPMHLNQNQFLTASSTTNLYHNITNLQNQQQQQQQNSNLNNIYDTILAIVDMSTGHRLDIMLNNVNVQKDMSLPLSVLTSTTNNNLLSPNQSNNNDTGLNQGIFGSDTLSNRHNDPLLSLQQHYQQQQFNNNLNNGSNATAATNNNTSTNIVDDSTLQNTINKSILQQQEQSKCQFELKILNPKQILTDLNKLNIIPTWLAQQQQQQQQQPNEHNKDVATKSLHNFQSNSILRQNSALNSPKLSQQHPLLPSSSNLQGNNSAVAHSGAVNSNATTSNNNTNTIKSIKPEVAALTTPHITIPICYNPIPSYNSNNTTLNSNTNQSNKLVVVNNVFGNKMLFQCSTQQQKDLLCDILSAYITTKLQQQYQQTQPQHTPQQQQHLTPNQHRF
jgi:hypothetical protein